MENLGVKIEGRRNKNEEMQDSRRFEKLEICEVTPPFSILFESCADVISMMTLKTAVAFPSLTENSGRCVNPNDFKQCQPARRTCRWNLLHDSLTDNLKH